MAIGGDHSITGGILQALGNGHLAAGQPISLLHIDAHTDVFSKVPHFLGAKKSAAHWGAYLADQGQVDPRSSMQIGIRGNPRTLDWLEPSYEYGYNVVTMKEVRRRGLADVIAQTKEVLADRTAHRPSTTALSSVSSVALRAHQRLSSSFCLSHASGVSRAGPVYITFDLDALDPTVAPGVSNLEPGEQGFLVDDAMELLRSVRGMNLVGGDVVCLMPTRDQPNMITARTAAAVMFEMVAMLAENQLARRGA